MAFVQSLMYTFAVRPLAAVSQFIALKPFVFAFEQQCAEGNTGLEGNEDDGDRHALD